MAVLMAAEAAEKSGAVAGADGADSSAALRNDNQKGKDKNRRAVVAITGLRTRGRRMRLASEPTAKVTAAPMSTYQVQATLGTVTPKMCTAAGCSHRVILRAKPVIMPAIAPACVA